MAKYAILSDIHANSDALKVVLEKCREIGVDHFVSLGDIVGYNAEPRECLYLVRDLAWVAMVRGNHDFWWSTAKKAYDFFEAHDMHTMDILNNNCYFYGDYAICGTRGWFYEEDAAGTHTGKMLAREALRLEASLKAAEGKPIYCFLHYPPVYQGYQCPEMLALLDKYEVERCYYGHLHGYTHRRAFEGMRGKTEYALIAADYVAFQPVKICN